MNWTLSKKNAVDMATTNPMYAISVEVLAVSDLSKSVRVISSASDASDG